MKVVQLTTDNRSPFKEFHKTRPWFGPAPEALIAGFEQVPEIELHIVSCIRQPVESPVKLAGNIWFHSLHVPKLGWMRTLYQGCIRATRRKVQEIRPDIVHGQGTELDCALGAVFSGFPNVITIHGNMAELARLFRSKPGSFYWLAGKLEDFALKRTHGVFCNSAYTERLVTARNPQVWRVANALHPRYFDPPKPRPLMTKRKPVLLNVGLITERKRQMELLGVIKTLADRGLVFEVVFVGQTLAGDPYAAAFLEQIKPLERIGCARYAGTKSTAELIEMYDAAAGLVHCPYEESFGLVVAEALARGLRLFGSRTGGIVDIAEGIPGVELFDVPDWGSLTEALAAWIRERCPRVAGAAEQMRQRYHPEAIARMHLDIYRQVLQNPKS